MLIRILFAAVVLIGIWWALRKLRKMPPKEQKKAYWNLAIGALIVITLFAVFTGRMHWLGGLIAGLFGLGKLGVRYLPFIKLLGKSQLFGNPSFKTPHIHAQVDLQTGEITGKVIAGRFEGKDLHDLSDDEINQLQADLKEKDKRAFYLLHVVAQRRGGTSQRKQNENASGSSYLDSGEITVGDAEQVLGLKAGYSKEDVVAAHRKLIQKLHPDRGGNDFLASQVNLAKDTLLKHLS